MRSPKNFEQLGGQGALLRYRYLEPNGMGQLVGGREVNISLASEKVGNKCR